MDDFFYTRRRPVYPGAKKNTDVTMWVLFGLIVFLLIVTGVSIGLAAYYGNQASKKPHKKDAGGPAK